MIYHIVNRQTWESAQAVGSYNAPSLATEGFIHCSQAHQVAWVANRFYVGQTDLVILHIDEARLTAPLKVENPVHPNQDPAIPIPAHHKDQFPHIYGMLNVDAVVKVVPYSADENGLFPAL